MTHEEIKATLERALATETPVRITEERKGRRWSYTNHHRATRIACIQLEKRRGTVIVLTDLVRVKLAQITAVEVVTP